MCGGPWHLATGHFVSERRHWCGPCTRDLIKVLKDHLARRVAKIRFYDFATVPPLKPPEGWE